LAVALVASSAILKILAEKTLAAGAYASALREIPTGVGVTRQESLLARGLVVET
jgi:hypothetical protein